MGESILNITNPIMVNGENIATKHLPIDGSNELMDAIFPIPKNDPKLNNNYNICLFSFNIFMSFTTMKKVYLQKRMHASIESIRND